MNGVIKIFVDVVVILIVGAVGLGLEFVASPSTPFQRGFYCNDESIRYPYHEDTVSTAMLTGVGIAIPVFTMFIIEWILYDRSSAKHSHASKPLYIRVKVGKYSIHPYAVALYCTITSFIFGMAITGLLTNCSKYIIGRLRPHFIDVCDPDFSKINCTDEYGNPIYVTEFVCRGTDEKRLTDARLSFPSGHSSFAFYFFVYWAMYLQARFVFSPFVFLKSFLQVVGIALALFCAETRISDYKHHPGDVLIGSFLGVVIAILTVVYVSDLHSRRLQSCMPPQPPQIQISTIDNLPVKNYGSVELNREQSSASNNTVVTEADEENQNNQNHVP